MGLTSIYKRVKGKLEKTNGEGIVSHKGNEKNLPSTDVFTDRPWWRLSEIEGKVLTERRLSEVSEAQGGRESPKLPREKGHHSSNGPRHPKFTSGFHKEKGKMLDYFDMETLCWLKATVNVRRPPRQPRKCTLHWTCSRMCPQNPYLPRKK